MHIVDDILEQVEGVEMKEDTLSKLLIEGAVNSKVESKQLTC